jgi:hypothetical protein
MVMTEEPEPGAGIVVGLKPTVVPVGMPEADRLMALLKPLLIAVVMVEVPWFPWLMVSEEGDALMVNPAGARKATICMIQPPEGKTGATAL